MKIGVIGLGKLGSCLAEVMAKHYKVIGVDLEPKYSDNYYATEDFERLEDCEVVFNVVIG